MWRRWGRLSLALRSCGEAAEGGTARVKSGTPAVQRGSAEDLEDGDLERRGALRTLKTVIDKGGRRLQRRAVQTKRVGRRTCWRAVGRGL